MMILECNKLFCHLPGEALARLTQHAREQQFAAGETLFSKGDPADGLYLLQDGEVEVSDVGRDGQRHVLAVLAPGDLFGEMAVLDGQPRSADASARVDSTVCFVPGEEVLCLLEESPELTLKLLREMSGRLREFNRHQIH